MALFYIILLYLYLMLALLLLQHLKTVLFHFVLYSLNMNLIFLSFLITFPGYIRFLVLISFNNISILIFPPLSFSMFNFVYNILFIHYGGNVIFSNKKEKCKDFPFVQTFFYSLLYYSIFNLQCLSKFDISI